MVIAVTNHVSHVHHALHKVVNNAKPITHTWANHARIKPDRRKVPQNQLLQLALARSARGSLHVRRMHRLVAHKAIVQPLAVNAAANRNTKLYLNRGAILIGSAIVISQFCIPVPLSSAIPSTLTLSIVNMHPMHKKCRLHTG